MLPTFFTGGKWDFQVANLLLATINFEPRLEEEAEFNYNFISFIFFVLISLSKLNLARNFQLDGKFVADKTLKCYIIQYRVRNLTLSKSFTGAA